VVLPLVLLPLLERTAERELSGVMVYIYKRYKENHRKEQKYRLMTACIYYLGFIDGLK
jgi:hypothetical protein